MDNIYTLSSHLCVIHNSAKICFFLSFPIVLSENVPYNLDVYILIFKKPLNVTMEFNNFNRETS